MFESQNATAHAVLRVQGKILVEVRITDGGVGFCAPRTVVVTTENAGACDCTSPGEGAGEGAFEGEGVGAGDGASVGAGVGAAHEFKSHGSEVCVTREGSG